MGFSMGKDRNEIRMTHAARVQCLGFRVLVVGIGI